MRVACVRAVAGVLFVGAGTALAVAAETRYGLSMDLLAEDGSVALHQSLNCPRYDNCLAELPYVLEGKQITVYVKAQVLDDHHIAVRISPPLLRPTLSDRDLAVSPFDGVSRTMAFEPGNEWTIDLRRTFKLPKDATKQQFKSDTTDSEKRTVLKVRMKLDG